MRQGSLTPRENRQSETMQHVLTNQVSDLKKIYDGNIELVSVARSSSERLECLADELFKRRALIELDWRQAVTDKETPLRELECVMQRTEEVTLLADEIYFVNEILHEFLHCEEVRVRVATIHGLMCPKFHTDHVYCRMLVTVTGPSTEWIACDDVQQDILSDPDSDALPIKEGKTFRKLIPGDMSLLKGGNWQSGFRGVVHRSPHEEGPRLLLTFDPIFVG